MAGTTLQLENLRLVKETHQSDGGRASLADLSTSTQHVFNLSALFAMTCFSHASIQDTRVYALPVAVRCRASWQVGLSDCHCVLYGLRTELCRVVYADKLLLYSQGTAFRISGYRRPRYPEFDGTEHYVRLTAALGVETVFWAPPRDRIVQVCCPHSAEKVPPS